MSLTIDPDRLRADFDALAQFGAFQDEHGHWGVDRPALGPAHLEARRWFRARAAEAGLETHVDPAGNHSAILRASSGAPSLGHTATLLLGSHLDSVPRGGRFDGALGVVAALEVLRTVKEAGIALPVALEAIDFTDEEGTLVGLLGSQALAGSLSPAAIERPRGGQAALDAGLVRAGLHPARLGEARRSPASLAGYLELHIEQGPRLAAAGVPIGVVTGIVGIRSVWLTFRGAANHAGTTPMDARRDAGVGAAMFLLAAREMVLRDFPGCVVNVGKVDLQPGSFNIVPGAAVLALEFRAPEAHRLQDLERSLIDLAQAVAQQRDLALDTEPGGTCVPAPMSSRVQATITAAAESLGLRTLALASGAGHDAQSLAPITPAGMIFVPSPGGISHSAQEFTEWADCVNGANVLLRAALGLAQSG